MTNGLENKTEKGFPFAGISNIPIIVKYGKDQRILFRDSTSTNNTYISGIIRDSDDTHLLLEEVYEFHIPEGSHHWVRDHIKMFQKENFYLFLKKYEERISSVKKILVCQNISFRDVYLICTNEDATFFPSIGASSTIPPHESIDKRGFHILSFPDFCFSNIKKPKSPIIIEFIPHSERSPVSEEACKAYLANRDNFEIWIREEDIEKLNEFDYYNKYSFLKGE